MSNGEEERKDDFGEGTFEDLVTFFEEMVHTMVPDVEYELEANEERGGLEFDFYFESEDKIGLFIGKKALNINIMQMWLRAQQIFPHNRYIYINVWRPDDESRRDAQCFVDKNLQRDFAYHVERECRQ